MGLTVSFFPEKLSTQVGLGSQAEPLSAKTKMQETEGTGSKSLYFLSDKTESQASEILASMAFHDAFHPVPQESSMVPLHADGHQEHTARVARLRGYP